MFYTVQMKNEPVSLMTLKCPKHSWKKIMIMSYITAQSIFAHL